MKPYIYPLLLLKDFPEHRLWQLFVDGSMHLKEAGEAGFEKREPGCIAAFYSAFNYALQNIDKKYDVEFMFKLHELASTNVKGIFGAITPGKFRKNSMCPFDVSPERYTMRGVESFMKAATNNTMGTLKGILKNFGLDIEFTEQNCQQIYTLVSHLQFEPPFNNPEDLLPRANILIEELHLNLIKAQQQNDRNAIINAIVHFVRFMELLHPFGDGNGRVFVNLSLNFLLIQNGMLPVTFYEPNIFDMYSDEELVEAVKDGMNYTLFTIKNPEAPLFGYIPPLKKDFATYSIKNTIQTYIDNNTLINTLTACSYIEELETYLSCVWDKKYNLHRYAATGEVNKVKEFSYHELQTYCLVNAPETLAPVYKFLAPLHIACKMNNHEVASYLIKLLKDIVNQQDELGNTPIYYAIQVGNEALIMELIDHGANLKVINKNKEYPLNWVARYSDYKIFELILLKTGSKSISGFTDKDILHLIREAARGDNLSILKKIIDNYKIQVKTIMAHLKCNFGTNYDPLIISLNHKSFKSFEFLLERTFPEKNMQFSLLEEYLVPIINGNDVSLFKKALEYTDLSTKSRTIKFEVLHEGLIKKHHNLEIPCQLIALEPDIAKLESEKRLPFILAASGAGLLEICILLINAGCNPIHECEGKTPLSVAARYNRLNVIEYLVNDLKVDPNYTPKIPEYLMNETKNTRTLFFRVFPEEEPISPLATAVKYGHKEAVNLLLELGATIDETTKEVLCNCNNKNKIDIELLLQSKIEKLI